MKSCALNSSKQFAHDLDKNYSAPKHGRNFYEIYFRDHVTFHKNRALKTRSHMVYPKLMYTIVLLPKYFRLV